MAGLLGSGNHLNTTDRASELSSSSISSPPVSPHQPGVFSDTIHVASRPQSVVHDIQREGVVTAPAASPAGTALQSGTATPPQDKPKRQRKKKELGLDGKPIEDDKSKEKKPRKPREPKAAANGAASTSTATSRKKVKVEDSKMTDSNNNSNSNTVPRKANIMDLIGNTASSNAAPSAVTSLVPPSTQNSTSVSQTTLSSTSNMAANRPITSGQRYDPVRAAMMEAAGLVPRSQSSNLSTTQSNTNVVKRASASPSIASLIDPPARSNVTTPSLLHSPQTATSTHTIVQTSPQQSSLAFPSSSSHPSALSASPSAPRTTTVLSEMSESMDVDAATSSFKPVSKEDIPADLKQSKPPSTAPTPKPTAATSRSSPSGAKGTRSGLLTTSDLTGDASSDDILKRKGVNIDIHISLNRAGNNHINLAQEITKKYGRDALYPRAAAHREELMQVMSAAKNLGAGSADDMSLDLNSDLEDDSNVEMGGMEDTADGEKPRKRRKKVEEYDLEDDFIDDTELAWQQEAAVAKDGFFVYSGPLITEAQASRDEAAASSSRGGRGRGRGRGRGAAASASHASLAEKKDTSSTATHSASGTSGRGRGRGRGTGAPRKPRITKADKERMEAEKTDRERAAVGLGPTPSASTPLVVSATAHAQQNGTTVA